MITHLSAISPFQLLWLLYLLVLSLRYLSVQLNYIEPSRGDKLFPSIKKNGASISVIMNLCIHLFSWKNSADQLCLRRASFCTMNRVKRSWNIVA
jgi:hypothetical protein